MKLIVKNKHTRWNRFICLCNGHSPTQIQGKRPNHKYCFVCGLDLTPPPQRRIW
jgi:hypothetical protein